MGSKKAQNLLGDKMQTIIPIYKPWIFPRTLWPAHDALESGWVSSIGEYNDRAIDLLRNRFGYQYIVLTSSGTAANHLMVECLKWKFPQNKTVLVPNNVYVAAWNPFLYTNYHGLYALDADLDTWNMKLDSTMCYGDNILLVVHNLGNPINVPFIKRRYPQLIVVEDNCEGIGGIYEGDYTGKQSIYSTLSFYANKTICAGEGGAFITNDRESFKYAYKLHGQGMSDKRYVHDVLGFNYRMTNVQAAILYGQLMYYDEIAQKKNFVFNYYRYAFSNHNRISVQYQETGCIHSRWMFGIRMKGNLRYEHVEKFFTQHGIETRPMFYPIHAHRHLRNVSGNGDENATLLSKECFMIPSYPELTEEQLEHVVNVVKKYAKEPIYEQEYC